MDNYRRELGHDKDKGSHDHDPTVRERFVIVEG